MAHDKPAEQKAKTKKPDKRQEQTLLWTGRCDRALWLVFYLSLAGGATVFLPELFFDGFEVPKLFLLQLGAAAFVFLLLVRSALKGTLEITLPPVAAPLAALFLLSAASIAWGMNPLLGLEELYRVSVLAGFCFFAYYLYRTRRISTPFYFILFASLALSLWALILDYNEALRELIYPTKYYDIKAQVVTGQPSAFYRGLIGNQGNPNFLMHILALSAPLGLGAFVHELVSPPRPAWRRLILFLFALAAAVPSFCILVSQNRSGLLALAAGSVFFAFFLVRRERRQLTHALKQWLKSPRGRMSLTLLALGLLTAVIFMISTTRGRSLAPRMARFASERIQTWADRFGRLKNLEDVGVYSRVMFLEAGARMIREDPLLGQGIGQFVLEFPGYKLKKHWYIFYMMHPPILRWDDMPRQSHNEFLQVCLATGIIGLFIFMAFWIILFLLVMRYFKREGDSRFRYLVLGAGAGIFATLVNSLFTFPLQTATSATFFWTAVGLLLAEFNRPGSEPGGLARERPWIRLSLQSKSAKRLLAFGALAMLILCISGSVRLVKARYLFFAALKQHAYDDYYGGREYLDYSIRRCETSVQLVPYHFETEHVLAHLYKLDNNTTGALEHFERTIELAPYFPDPYTHLPKLYLRNRERAKAEAVIRRLYAILPPGIPDTPDSLEVPGINYDELNYLLGWCILHDTTDGNFDEAEKWLKKSNTLDADMELGIAYYERARYDQAAAIFERWSVDRGRGTNIEARLVALRYLGLIYIKQEKWESARETFEKVSRIAGENAPDFSQIAQEALDNLEFINRNLAAQDSR